MTHPDESDEHPLEEGADGESQAEDRFPAIVLAGPGIFGLMFASIAPKSGNAGGFSAGVVGGVIALAAFAVLARRARSDKERFVWIALACAGPLLVMAEIMRRI